MTMAFNKDVTDLKFYVSDHSKIGDVSSLLESMIADWVKSTCTHWGREFIPPFTVEQLPAGEKCHFEPVLFKSSWFMENC